MRKIILLSLFILAYVFNSCSDDKTIKDWKCGIHNGKTLWKGSEGGCYYYNDNENKIYVDRAECKC
ncbi:hypothetical protein [Tenacibaculum finnmarkense]|uniref:hypothetical protein n=1 Tax=Tenacibaculum finnmarkense TaxID=2781243 RepID=UPI001E30BD7E|nr:hypothetical protein [Tenacibaculum finnmarkense]MCD8401383.1 hypothetical protein [Tenacibaculum finnmarkense genomovar ulcerans]MCD8408607.1 hypothetical protein [Tenacibaculum dicentrarchi]MCD8450439.1 hypothetical protein [Tenacibaculum dicentrarchi]MCG8748002.1 hypothetical protein [Tenacibaculum finnmarkense]